ncbi:MAG: hypothetical protein NWF00_01355 [Candidatus Bathyarchaeota archaeon]|nr:hypothetical protein [Candidatus Bathyarchaeota archaeon]
MKFTKPIYTKQDIVFYDDCSMSTEKFIADVHEKHKQDIAEIVELLEVLKGLQKEEKTVYEISVTSNL